MIHKTFGSSTAERTDACTAWVHLSEGIPNHESSFALFGTTVHAMLECRALNDDFTPRLEMLVGGEIITQEHIDMYDQMWQATETVLEQYQAVEWEPECTGSAEEDVGGTLDLIASCQDRALLIDYKTGMGKMVSPVNNKQILFAAAVCEIDSQGADLLEPHDLFTGIILQPNRAGEVEIKTWDFTRDQVDAFWESHTANILLARQGDSDPVTGDHCAFCPAAATRCPAKNGDALRALQMDATDLGHLAQNMDMVEDLKKWCAAVEKAAYQQLEVGSTVTGWKLVAKRATEQWVDAAVMVKKLRLKLGGKKNLVQEKPITPAAVKRLAKARDVEIDLTGLTKKESSGTTLAPESDKREAVLSAEAFGAALASIA